MARDPMCAEDTSTMQIDHVHVSPGAGGTTSRNAKSYRIRGVLPLLDLTLQQEAPADRKTTRKTIEAGRHYQFRPAIF